MDNRFCVYVHLRPDGSPFYVGKGTIARAKWKKRRANPYHKNILAKYGLKNISVRIIKRGLSEADAHAYEKDAIACLRAFDYELCNLTDGGEGSSGWVAPPETRARMSATRKGRPGHKHTPEIIALLSRLAKQRGGKPHTPESRRKLSEAHKGKKFSAQHRAKLSVVARNRSPDANMKNSLWHKARRYSDETKEKMRVAHTAKWHTEETKKKMSESAKIIWQKRKEQQDG